MSRLPPPPRGGKPLPPDPQGSQSNDVPPPLPSRPRGHLPPPPRPSSPEEEEPETYEEPDIPPPRPPMNNPPSSMPMSNRPPSPGEIYDELEGTTGQDPPSLPGLHPPPISMIDDGPTETYDACSFGNDPDAPEPQDIYEATEEDLVQDSLYEIEPSVSPAAPLPPPVGGIPPKLPHRPPPSKDKAPDNSPELPSRTAPNPPNSKLAKKILGDGQQAAISLDELGLGKNRLRKVSSTEEKKEPPTTVVPDTCSNGLDSGNNSVRDRILKFQASKKPPIANKPAMAVKPMGSSFPDPPPPIVKEDKPSPPRQERNFSPPPPPSPPVFEEEELYDEGFSYMDPLQGQEWFHGELDRKDSTKKLNSVAEDGTFLVRKAQKGGPDQPYTLVVLYQKHEYNLKVRKRSDGKVALGEPKDDELAFENVPALIDHHRKNDVILVNRKENRQYQTILKKYPLAIRR